MSANARILSAIALGVLLVAIGLLAFVNLSRNRGYARGPANLEAAARGPAADTIAAGKMAANFQLDDLQGQPISLSSMQGKVVFLNIWATWCAPCRAEMASIETLYNEFKNDKDFVVLAVSQDTAGSRAVVPYVRKNGLKFTVLLDPRNEVGEKYGVDGIPETFIIGRDGRIVAHHVGPYDWANGDIRDALEELLKSKSG